MTSGLPIHTQHVKALDGLRGYAAILVTFFHTILNLEPTLVERVLSPAIGQIGRADWVNKLALIMFNGTTAVALFYVLSGAVLCQSLLRTTLTFRTSGLFFLRRILRLFPVLIVCMLTMWALSVAYNGIGIHTYPLITAANAIKNALLLDTRFHGPSTSIQIEVLATPFIFLFAFLYRRYAVLIAAVFLTLSIVAIQEPNLVFSLPNMNASLFLFVIGMVIALPEAKNLFSEITTGKLIILLVFCFLLRHLVHIESLPGLIAQGMLLGTLVGFVLHTVKPSRFHLFLENRYSQFLGRISYSYYLFNVPVLFILWFTPRLEFVAQWKNPVLGGLVVGLISVVITLPIAYFSHKYCELPFIHFGKKLTLKFLRPGLGSTQQATLQSDAKLIGDVTDQLEQEVQERKALA
ncbi:MAG: acyltransferase [Pseudomonadota bacterium]